MKLWKKLRDSLPRQDIPGYSNFESGGHCFFTIIWMASWKNRLYWCFLFSAHHSIVFCFRCSVYWWKGSVGY